MMSPWARVTVLLCRGYKLVTVPVSRETIISSNGMLCSFRNTHMLLEGWERMSKYNNSTILHYQCLLCAISENEVHKNMIRWKSVLYRIGGNVEVMFLYCYGGVPEVIWPHFTSKTVQNGKMWSSMGIGEVSHNVWQ